MSKRDRGYLDAVLRGDFRGAEAAFDALPFTLRVVVEHRAAGLIVDHRTGFLDRVLTAVGDEGPKGPWRVRSGERCLLYAFDEYVTLRPNLTRGEKGALIRVELIDDR